MGRFLITPEMNPGMYRGEAGFYAVGQVIELPDAASQPGDFVSPKLMPLDDEALKMIAESEERRRAAYAEKKISVPARKLYEIPEWAKAGHIKPPEPPKDDEGTTLGDVAKSGLFGSRRGRKSER